MLERIGNQAHKNHLQANGFKPLFSFGGIHYYLRTKKLLAAIESFNQTYFNF